MASPSDSATSRDIAIAAESKPLSKMLSARRVVLWNCQAPAISEMMSKGGRMINVSRALKELGFMRAPAP